MSSNRITRRQFITRAGAAALAVPFINLRRATAETDRPNFVFILTDDQRWDAMSCMGHPFLHTPNMDRLAREGAMFRNAFVTISLCSPSRACFLTGQYAHKHGITDNKTSLPDDIPTYPQILRKAGYDTAFIGKWHMDGQVGPRPGFNRWVSFKGQGTYFDPALYLDSDRPEETPGYMTDLLAKYAVDWLRQPRSSPFMLYLCHKAVHGPFQPAVRHSKLYSDVTIPRPVSFNETTGKPNWLEKRQETREDAENAKSRYEGFIRNYNRTLVAVDDSIGRMLATLEETGQLDNTVVVFTSDNGYFQGEHGLLDKRAAYEESIRIPLLMRYPRLIRPGTVIDQMALNIDLCPTFLDLARAQIPDKVQGRSLRPVLAGRPCPWRNDFLYEYFFEEPFKTPTIRAVRGQRFKYVEYPEIDDIAELYDIKNDPYEMRNLIAEPGSASTLARMKSRLAQLLEETK